MEYGQFLLGQEFNKNFADVLNCKIVAPPYYPGEVPHTFFFAKRDGFARQFADELSTQLDAYDEVIDFERIVTGTLVTYWFIVKSGANVLLLHGTGTVGAPVTLWVKVTNTFVDGVNYKFFYMPHVRGKVSTVPNADWNQNVFYGDDTGGTLKISRYASPTYFPAVTTPDQYAGKYLYMFNSDANNGAGIGQVLKVDYQQDQQYLVVTSTGWKAKPTACRMKIYEDYGSCLACVMTDYVYTLPQFDSHDVVTASQEANPAYNYSNPVDVTFTWNRLYAIQRNANSTYSRNVLGGGEGFFSLYLWGSSLIGSVKEAFNIVQFQDYVLVVSRGWIDTVAKLTTKINNTETSIDILVNVTKDVTLFGQNAFTVYNWGLYVFTETKKFVWVSIASENVYRYVVTLQNQWIYQQKFFDTFSANDEIRIVIEDLDIYLFRSSSSGSSVFRYSNFYKGWYRWETALNIRSYKNQTFFGESLFVPSLGSVTDDPTWTPSQYDERVQIVLGEDAPFAIKHNYFIKAYIGEESTDGTLMNVIAYGNGQRFDYSIPLSDAQYFFRLGTASSGGSLGTTLLGTGIYMSGSSEVSGTAPLANVKWNTWFAYEVAIIELKASGDDKFQLWGLIVGHGVMPPQNTPFENVV